MILLQVLLDPGLWGPEDTNEFVPERDFDAHGYREKIAKPVDFLDRRICQVWRIFFKVIIVSIFDLQLIWTI